MNMRGPLRILEFARLALAAICGFAALAGSLLGIQAYELLIDPFRFNGAFIIALASGALLIASAMLAFDWRGGLPASFASGAAMLMVVVVGLYLMGETSLHEAFLQASCAPGYAWCSIQAATVVRLCVALVIGGATLASFRYYLLKRG